LVITDFPETFFADANNANEFIDSVLTAVKAQFGTQLDPFHLPDEEIFHFGKKIGPIDLGGSAKLSNGTLKGLSTLHRIGDSTIATEEGQFTAHLEISLEKLDFLYHAEVEFLSIIHPKFELLGTVGTLNINIALAVDGDGKPILKEFHVQDLVDVVIHEHGLGEVDTLVDLFTNAFIQFFNPTVKSLLDSVLQPMIAGLLGDFKLGGY